jgi:hypothetical protein
MFDKIKKFFGKEDEPKTDLTLFQMKKGYFVDYFMQSWEVKEHAEYDFDGAGIGTEYLIDNGSEKQYLFVMEKGTENEVSLAKSIALNKIDSRIRTNIIEFDKSPHSFFYEDEEYFLFEASSGHYKQYDEGDDDWAQFVMYDYRNKEEDKFVSISRWSETELEAAAGTFVKDYEFSNIIPR